MQCSKCDSDMEKVEFHGIEIDRCVKCRGIWFDMLESENLKVLRDSESIDVGDPQVGAEYNKVDKIDCPACHTKMIRMVDREQPHIWYEACTVCYGVFFDAGEFTDYKEVTVSGFFKDILAKERK